MKKLIILLLLLSASIAGYSQTGFSGVFLRVQDSAAYVNSSNTIAKHTAGYADIWYSDASNLFWKWNGSSYEAFGASSIDGSTALNSYAGSHTLVAGDVNDFNDNGVIRFTIAGPANLTVPLNATVAFDIPSQIGIDNQGSDTLTVVWTGGVTGNDGGYAEIFPGGSALLIKVGTNEWDLLGTQPGGGGSEVTPAALTKTDDTNVTLTLGGTPTTALLQATSITAGWTGTLSGTRGGTGVNNGASTITLAGNLVTSGANSLTLTTTGATNVTLPTTGTVATRAGTETFTNKRLTPRIQSVASSATVTPDADANDAVKITAQAATLTLANPSGTPDPMQAMIIRIKDNGTPRNITFGSQYRGVGIILPPATITSKTMYMGLVWNSEDSTWDVIGLSVEQ